MNKALMTGLVIGSVVTVTGGAVAGLKLLDRGRAYAEVLSVTPVTRTVQTPRQECRDEAVVQPAPTRDPNRVTGTVVGAVVGGVLGNQIGDGSGRKIATIAGAAAGGYAGNRIQKRIQDNRVQTTTERRCTTVYDSHEEPAGFDVHYRIGDIEGRVRMDRHPGERIPVRDGQLVLDEPGTEG